MSKMPEAYAEARATEIRDAATRVFVRKGIDAATMQDIASEAGLSAGAIYRYFEGKEQLIRTVFEHCAEESRQLFDDVRVESVPLSDALFVVGRTVWDEFRKPGIRDQYALRLAATLVGSRMDDSLGTAMRVTHTEVLDRLAGLIHQMQQSGELREDVDVDALALTILSCVQGLRLLFVEFDEEINTEGVYKMLGVMVRNLMAA